MWSVTEISLQAPGLCPRLVAVIETGRFPERAVFDDMRRDVRGKPVWEAASWNLKA